MVIPWAISAQEHGEEQWVLFRHREIERQNEKGKNNRSEGIFTEMSSDNRMLIEMLFTEMSAERDE